MALCEQHGVCRAWRRVAGRVRHRATAHGRDSGSNDRRISVRTVERVAMTGQVAGGAASGPIAVP